MEKMGGVASEKKSLPFHAFLCALALTGCLMPGVAEANTQYGPGASATGGDSVAVGDSAKATAGHATAIGTLTEADGTNSFVAGLQAKSGATAENSVAIGRGAQALGQKRVSEQFTASTIAIGNNATATENGDIVIGRQAKSTVSQYHNHPQGGNGAVVMGAEAASYGSRGDVVLGAGAEACLLRKDVTNPADKSEYSQGVAIGSRAKVYGTQSTSIGADSRSIGHSSIAIGGDDIDKAKPVLTAAIPDMATTGVQKNFNRELAVLYPGTTLGSAAINDSKNYVNTASIGNASMAIGMMTQSYGTGSTAIGVNTLTKGIASTGIGVMARSWGDKSLALGSRAETYGNKSTAVGDANTVGFDMTDGTTSGAASSAVGTDNKVYGNNSYAIGGGNTIGSATITETTEANGDKIKKVTAGTVKGSTAGAFGYKNTVTTDNAYVVGNNSTASADGAMVLGSSASVTGKNGVALGNNTKVANENAVAIGNGSETAAAVATPSATINGVAHNFAGVNPASTVSVGKAGAERTITNVAAGRISATSTDAINGSQLYAVTSKELFEKYVSPEDANMIDAAKNKTGYFSPAFADPTVFIVNKKLAGDMKIAGFDDLLNPALKGKIACGDPANSSSAFQVLMAMLYAKGKDGDPMSPEAWAYVDNFIKNVDGKFLNSSGAVHKGAADGEYTVGLTWEDPAATYVKNGADVEVVFPKEGAIFPGESVQIIKGAKHMENAKKFVDFMLSQKIQEAAGKTLTVRPLRKGVKLADYMTPQDTIALFKNYDEGWVAAHKKEVVAEWNKHLENSRQ